MHAGKTSEGRGAVTKKRIISTSVAIALAAFVILRSATGGWAFLKLFSIVPLSVAIAIWIIGDRDGIDGMTDD